MKTLLARFFIALLLCLTILPAPAGELVWLTDLAKAQAQAKVEKKSVLLVFHGSDWCPPCVEMTGQRAPMGIPQF